MSIFGGDGGIWVNQGVAGALPSQQQSPGLLHLKWFKSLRITYENKKDTHKGCLSYFGGDGGIWTPARLAAPSGFRIRTLQPLGYISLLQARVLYQPKAKKSRLFLKIWINVKAFWAHGDWMGCHGVVYYTKRKVIGMLFDTTSYLLEQIGPFVEKVDVQISTDHKDWRGRSYQSNLVRIGDGSHVRFEVFEDEVIVGFFTDHCH